MCVDFDSSATAIQHPWPGGAFLQSWFGRWFPPFFTDEFRFLPFGFQTQTTGQHHRWIEQSPSLTAAFRTFCVGVAIRDRSPHFIGWAFVGGTGEFVNGHGLEWIKKKEPIERLTPSLLSWDGCPSARKNVLVED